MLSKDTFYMCSISQGKSHLQRPVYLQQPLPIKLPIAILIFCFHLLVLLLHHLASRPLPSQFKFLLEFTLKIIFLVHILQVFHTTKLQQFACLVQCHKSILISDMAYITAVVMVCFPTHLVLGCLSYMCVVVCLT
jgi:hypothetical protein